MRCGFGFGCFFNIFWVGGLFWVCSGEGEHGDGVGGEGEGVGFGVVAVDVGEEVEVAGFLLHDSLLGAVQFCGGGLGDLEAIDASAGVACGESVASCRAGEPGVVFEAEPEVGVVEGGLAFDGGEFPIGACDP